MKSDLENHTSAPVTAPAHPRDFVAPLLPPTADTPAPVKRINFFMAFLFFWIVPRRLGPHMAAGSWKRAWAAHGLALVSVGMVIVFVGTALHGLFAETPDLPAREILAHLIIAAAESSAQGGWPDEEVLVALLSLPALEVTLFLLAIMLMPFCAGGDRAGSVFRRSMKNVLWSTTFFVPAAVVYVTLFNWMDRMGSGRLTRAPELLELGIALTLLLVPIVWWLRLLFVGAKQYVGPPDGPAFAPREPRCDDCGYLIVQLPRSNRCPECGLPVRVSLPGGRRTPTEWQRHPLNLEGLRAFFKTHHRVRIDRDFFKTLPVHDGLAKARHFWWLTCGFLIIANLAMVAVACFIAELTRGYGRGADAGMAVFNIPLLLAVQALVSFAVCLWGQGRHGIRDYRNSAIVCYYGAARMWRWWMLFSLTEAFVLSRLVMHFEGVVVYHVRGVDIDLAMVLVAVLILIMLVAAGGWIRSLARGLKQIRYASV